MNIKLDLDFFNLLNLNKNTMEADLTSNTFAKRVPLANPGAADSPPWSGVGLLVNLTFRTLPGADS